MPRLFSESLRDHILLGLAEADGTLERVLRLAVLEQAPVPNAAGLLPHAAPLREAQT